MPVFPTLTDELREMLKKAELDQRSTHVRILTLT